MIRDRRALLPAIAAWGLIALVTGCGNLHVPDPAVRFIAFGDSSTRGTSGQDYPNLLREAMGAEPGALANEGHGGETSGQGVLRLRDILRRGQYPSAHTLLYWEGGNDVLNFVRGTDPALTISPADANYPFHESLNATLDATQSNIEAAIAAARDARLAVYVATYYLPAEATLPCQALMLDVIQPEQAARGAAYVRLLNERIRRAAANAGAIVMDVEKQAPGLSDDASNFQNCNHLSAQGNAIVAELFRAAIQGTTATQPSQ